MDDHDDNRETDGHDGHDGDEDEEEDDDDDDDDDEGNPDRALHLHLRHRPHLQHRPDLHHPRSVLYFKVFPFLSLLLSCFQLHTVYNEIQIRSLDPDNVGF